MEYKRIKIQEHEIAYTVFDRARQTAEVSCFVSGEQFWIRDIRLESGYEDFRTFDAVVQFVQYKCWAAGCPALYVRLNMKNLFYLELYRRYGFRQIAQEERALPHGGMTLECVMKYALPNSREENYLSYLRRRDK